MEGRIVRHCGASEGPPDAVGRSSRQHIINQTYDRFINWLDEKKANMSASSTGVSTTFFLVGKSLKRCLVLSRESTMVAMFSIEPTELGGC